MEKTGYCVIYLDYRRPETLELAKMVWERICGDNLVGRIFYDGSVTDFTSFSGEILREGTLPFAVFLNGGLAGFCWLNNIMGKMARTHFTVFRQCWGKGRYRNLARGLFDLLFSLKDEHGFFFDSLMGITPENNKLAIRAALDSGWTRVGIIPGACYMADIDKSVAGVVTCSFRKEGEERRGSWQWEE